MSRCVLNEFELKSQTNNYTFTHGLVQGTTHSLALRGKQKRSERNYEKTNHELSFCFYFSGSVLGPIICNSVLIHLSQFDFF